MPHDGPPGHTLGMLCPQATVAGLVVGQRGAQTHRPLLHVSPEPQRVPTPGQVAPGQVLGMGAPQSTVLAAGHDGSQVQALSTQRCPVGHATPRPQVGPPSHALGISRPQPTWLGSM